MGTFRFKQFAVEQDSVAMKVGTDGVLLGAWVDVEGAKRILDIGTGTGVIALMLAQRTESAHIVGIDIDGGAVECAASNFAASPWADRLEAVFTSAQECVLTPFDLIVSNPPYFVDSLLCPDSRRTMARHTTELSFEELNSVVVRLLADNGRFALILPTEQMESFIALTTLSLVRRCDVSPVVGGTVKRVMALFSAKESIEPIRESIAIEAGGRGVYSEEYRELTKEFYLKF